MKKTGVIITSIVLSAGFGLLLYNGIRHARGVPVEIEKPEKIVLEVPFKDMDINLANGISLNFWDRIPAREVKLMYQLMALPWGKSLVSPVTLKAFHNKENIFFYMRWEDNTEDFIVDTNKFSDACAIMFPMKDELKPSIIVKPVTIMMGFLGKANIWQWKASRDREYWLKIYHEKKVYSDYYYPFEEKELFVVSREIIKSAVNDLMAVGIGTITIKEKQNVQGRGIWKDGIRHVVFKRALKQEDTQLDAVFNFQKKRLCAFAVWNGSQGDRGGKKSISDWVELELK